MRMRNLLKGDITFQIKYGFYFVYATFTLFYVVLLGLLPIGARGKVAAILVYTDPAAMGLFFMGAIVLLEKSQRVLNSIAVSPVRISEYILSKVISLGIISTLVGIIILYSSQSTGSSTWLFAIIGIFLGSVFFSLIGLCMAAKINSLNQFIVATVPFELLCFIPPILYLFGYGKEFLWLHPGSIIINMILGEAGQIQETILILIGWIIVVYLITYRIIKKMMLSVGGVKL